MCESGENGARARRARGLGALWPLCLLGIGDEVAPPPAACMAAAWLGLGAQAARRRGQPKSEPLTRAERSLQPGPTCRSWL